ncbi:hypothetical protein BDV3_005811 [Batrachochytrium dendrobatidis]|uniref:YEATS domain-containing protein n=1 Tax=Batrachochytrium dendrobatidis (strain JEL423) TaxID=403673 RepID=A0A177WLA7_BATDL|nr:hypothetical protein BDEG_24564 [Batrachochytrium dendrobatidis JEL423]
MQSLEDSIPDDCFTTASDSSDSANPSSESYQLAADAICRQFDVELLVRRQEITAIRTEIARTEYVLETLQYLLANGYDRVGLAGIIAGYEAKDHAVSFSEHGSANPRSLYKSHSTSIDPFPEPGDSDSYNSPANSSHLAEYKQPSIKAMSTKISGQHYLQRRFQQPSSPLNLPQTPEIKVYHEPVDWSDFETPISIEIAPIVISPNLSHSNTENSDTLDDNRYESCSKSDSDKNSVYMQDVGDASLEVDKNGSFFMLASDLKGHIKESRYHLIQEIIVGNTAELVAKEDQHFKIDKDQYKWTVFIKGSSNVGSKDFGCLVRKVRFFLHPDYRPYDVIDVTQPPFEVSRCGWGECPVRLQIHFWDPINKPINIIHMLNFHFSGENKAKGERKLEIEIHRSTKLKHSTHITADHDQTTNALEFGPECNSNSQATPSNIFDLSATEPAISNAVNLPESTSAFDSNTLTTLSSEIIELIEAGCKRYPIIRKDMISESSYSYSTASDFKSFMSWSMGKRKSVEFQRAKLVKQYIEMNSLTTVKLQTVVAWCRQLGHTPSSIRSFPRSQKMSSPPLVEKKDSIKPIYCLYCGKLNCLDCSQPIYSLFQTMSKFDVMRDRFSSDASICKNENRLSLDHTAKNSLCNQPDESFSSGSLLEAKSLEIQWVMAVLRRIPSSNWHVENVSQSTTSTQPVSRPILLVAMAVRMFLKDILQKAVTEYRSDGIGPNDCSRLLVPPYVFKGLLSNTCMLFLTNNGMINDSVEEFDDDCMVDEEYI